MLTLLPPELQCLVFSFVDLQDLVTLSRTTRQISRNVLSLFICDVCDKTDDVALCGPVARCPCSINLLCEECFPDHYRHMYHVGHYFGGYMPYTLDISTEVINGVFSFHFECIDKVDSDDDDGDDGYSEQAE
ncbi:hypothetical protein DM01DRAFT_1376032 [Hesseltinella vesiculosa]|uniref:F-box domain-containing protein n=1 Tax=Hesseltinella vesiculosa TaxID=101127 RepID=A0A1X2GBX4_9FUNG|nr:hypothetical protein DM01DRAFT_1376032 [Hesseltinella vesiculosa]